MAKKAADVLADVEAGDFSMEALRVRTWARLPSSHRS